MKRLLVFGFCPLPFENTSKSYGPGIRAWQFIQPLLNTPCEITFIANRIPFVYPNILPPEVFSQTCGFHYYNMSDTEFRNPHRIQEIHDRLMPDAILIATIFASSPLRSLKTSCPVWIDLFGHVMAEAQAKAYRYNSDDFLEHFRQHELFAISKGDIFSTVSQAQGFATIGELGLISRLNAATTGYSFCHTIPCAMESSCYSHDKWVMRGSSVPDNAFVVLWSGGFNTWTDVDTLIDGLEQAMAQNPDIWFVSTGGQIDGHDELTYPQFLQRVKKSRYRDRFLLKGWIPKQDVHNYYFESNIGINIDRYMYEGLLGSKNRVLDWMRAGLPSLIGELCEISRELPLKGLAYNYPLNNPEALAGKILQLAANPEEVAATGRRATEYGLSHLSFEATTQPFRDWLQDPAYAPDKSAGKPKSGKNFDVFDNTAAYVHNLENELSHKNRHVEQLENYIRHVENELGKAHVSGDKWAHPANRPALTRKPLPLTDSPLVSVILVTWNGMADINACLASVFSHDYPDIECIVVDNSSEDGTPDFIESHYPQTILIRNSSNEGFTDGVNKGIRHSKGEVIFLLNQDAELLPGLLNHLVRALRDESIAVAGCKIYDPDQRTIQHAGGILHDNGLTDHYGAGEHDTGQYNEDRDVTYVTGAALAFKRLLIDEIGVLDSRFSPAYFEELDYCIRATRVGYRIRYVHQAQALHHESTSTRKFSHRFYSLYHRNRLKFILKHYPLKYFFGTFMRAETSWLRRYAPREQLIPLIKAYLMTSHRVIWLFIRTVKRKVSR